MYEKACVMIEAQAESEAEREPPVEAPVKVPADTVPESSVEGTPLFTKFMKASERPSAKTESSSLFIDEKTSSRSDCNCDLLKAIVLHH
jgi:hypothetical protein